jgi:hypothetical protein
MRTVRTTNVKQVRAGWALLALILGMAPAGAAGTDFEGFDRQIGRSATDGINAARPKAACVCQDGSSRHGRAGVLLRTRRVETDFLSGKPVDVVDVVCRIPGFDVVTGAEATVGVCLVFAPLPR